MPGTRRPVEVSALNETHSCLLGDCSHTRVKTEEEDVGGSVRHQKEHLLVWIPDTLVCSQVRSLTSYYRPLGPLFSPEKQDNSDFAEFL